MSLAGAVRLDGSAVQLDEVPDDGKTETQSSMPAGRGRIGLAKTIEHERQHVASNANASIADPNLRAPLALRSVTVIRPPARELDRVRKNIPEHLLQPVSVCQDGGNVLTEIGLQTNAFPLHSRADGVDRRGENGPTSTDSIESLILPVMIRETSRTSSMSRICASALRSITSTAWAVVPSSWRTARSAPNRRSR